MMFLFHTHNIDWKQRLLARDPDQAVPQGSVWCGYEPLVSAIFFFRKAGL